MTDKFLSTPSARRATRIQWLRCPCRRYFYPRPPRGGRPSVSVTRSTSQGFLSTPSARRATEDDESLRKRVQEFLSTPSARRATGSALLFTTLPRFLSTPSARRATYRARLFEYLKRNFYPRPPRGGRRGVQIPSLAPKLFLSTPSARRATLPPRAVRSA